MQLLFISRYLKLIKHWSHNVRTAKPDLHGSSNFNRLTIFNFVTTFLSYSEHFMIFLSPSQYFQDSMKVLWGCFQVNILLWKGVNLPSATVLYDVFLILAVQIVCSTVATLHGCNSNFFTIELKLYKSMTESVIIRHFFSKFLCLICVTLYPIECNNKAFLFKVSLLNMCNSLSHWVQFLCQRVLCATGHIYHCAKKLYFCKSYIL